MKLSLGAQRYGRFGNSQGVSRQVPKGSGMVEEGISRQLHVYILSVYILT